MNTIVIVVSGGCLRDVYSNTLPDETMVKLIDHDELKERSELTEEDRELLVDKLTRNLNHVW